MLLKGIIFYLYFVLISNIYAGSFISGDNVTISYSETPTNIIITGSSVGASGDIIIPDYINELPVTVISNSAFGSRWNISSIELPSTLESIERYAFGDCNSISSINIPNGVTKIGYASFWSCDNLETANLPSGITEIAYGAFYNCKKLNNLGGLFNNVNGVLVDIGNRAFENTSLENIVIPNSVVSIGEYAFQYCSNLTSVVFGSSISNINDKAFFMCKSLEDITFTSTYPPHFGSEVFYEYWPNPNWGDTRPINGASITVPEMTVNYGLAGINFQGLPTIGASPYSWTLNEETEEITLTDCVDNYNNSGQLLIPSTLNGYPVTALDGTFYGSGFWSTFVNNITIPSSIKDIGNNTFRNENIYSVNIPSSVTNIGDYAFYDSKIRDIEIPSSVSTLNPYSFADCPLTNIILSSGLTEISNDVFNDSSLLEEIVIPDTVLSIGDSAFESCSGLKKVILSSNLQSIGERAFKGTNLTNIIFRSRICPSYNSNGLSSSFQEWVGREIEATVPEYGIGYGTYNGILPGYQRININGLTPLSYSILADNTILITGCDVQASGNLVLPSEIDGSSVVGISTLAFNGCTSIQSVNIPDSIEVIDSQAFQGCLDLEKVILENENININKNVFDQCNKLNLVDFNETEFTLLFDNPSEEIPYLVNLLSTIIPIGKTYITNNPSNYNLYKLSEIIDLRPSSSVISTSNDASELSFALEESTNLINWHTNQLIEVNLPVTNNIKFFRFRSF